MAGRLNTVAGRLVLMLLLIHAVLMPVLFLALETAVARTLTNAFLDDARHYARVIADGLETVDFDSGTATVVEYLDSAILGGRSNYAVLMYEGTAIASSLLDSHETDLFQEDFEFGEHGDETYYLSLPVWLDSHMGVLRLGFDEAPNTEHFEIVRSTIIYSLLAYMLLVLLASGYLGSTVVKPLKWLQTASRAVSSGEVDKELETQSSLVEIQELTADLEKMRSKLVGINAHLKREIADRELAESERRNLERYLRHAQRLESLGTLAGGVAHEFNNVLQPVLLYTDLALEDLPKASPTAKNLRRVLDLANRARSLSQQILTFGRQDTDTELELFNLTPVVHEALTMIRALLPATVDIRADINHDIGNVRCDPAQIKQLLVNLCNNAFRALAATQGYILISLKEVIVPSQMASEYLNLRAGEYVVLQVTDTGVGMDKKTAERAFEPFFTTQDVGQGTGLGLSVVHGIVVRHDGEIILESEAGKGTMVRIYLPLADEDVREQEGKRESHD
jgi:signal transduction histidine kinase